MNPTEYLKRINYDGPITANLATLQQLQKSHLLSVPFENLDIQNKIPIKLDLSRIYEKLVLNNRGGFCFELNGVFNELLVEIGFKTRLISGRVFKKNGRDLGNEFDHVAIVVTIDEQDYLVDVGFGEFSFSPLPLKLNVPIEDERGIFTFTNYDDSYTLVSKADSSGKEKREYIFTTESRNFQDFNGMCHYHQSNADSLFMQGKLITRPYENGRITLTNERLIETISGKTRMETIQSEMEFDEKLEQYFGFRLGEVKPIS